MSDFGKAARQVARQLSYTEYDAEEMSCRRAKVVGDVIARECEEARLDEVCALLDLDTSGLDEPAKAFGPEDVALAAWSNWGAGSLKRAASRSNLTEGEFITLNDYFNDLYKLE